MKQFESRDKFAKLANRENAEQCSAVSSQKIRQALAVLIQELNIRSGNFKVYVRNGRPAPSIEIQSEISKGI